MILVCWSTNAWADYLYWQATDRQIMKRIKRLIDDIERNGYGGIGKPEALRHQLQGYSSRRINDEHRLIYKIVEIAGVEQVWIVECRYHYEK